MKTAPTPRVDAEIERFVTLQSSRSGIYVVARNLERELADAQAQIERMRGALEPIYNVLSVCSIGWEPIFEKVKQALAKPSA